MSGSQPILAQDNLQLLSHFALSNVLLAFDYDGTLAPIAPNPERVRMRRRTRRLLSRAATLYPCVVISGRGLDDIARRLARIPVWHVFGNHGLESESAKAQPVAQTRAWVDRLTRDLAEHSGVVVEDKRLSVTVHYRSAHNRTAAIGAIDAAIQRLHGARIVGGKEAVNVLPFGGGDKGVALRGALQLFACQTAIYVGDDATDEDAFATAIHHQVLGIRVGAARGSLARYYLESQSDVDILLETLVDLRMREPSGSGENADTPPRAPQRSPNRGST